MDELERIRTARARDRASSVPRLRRAVLPRDHVSTDDAVSALMTVPGLRGTPLRLAAPTRRRLSGVRHVEWLPLGPLCGAATL